MTPLSDAIILVAVFIGALGLLGGAWLATKTGRGWKGFLTNLIVVALSSLLMVLSVGLVLNKFNAWYPNWSDLWGQPADNTVKTAGGNAEGAFATPSSATPPATNTSKPRELPALPAPGERVQQLTTQTAKGSNWSLTVILPQDYFAPERANQTYPVLIAGHGYPGSPEQWQGPLDIRASVDAAVEAKKMAPTIVVIPNITPGGQDTECISGPGGHDELEQWLGTQLPDFVSSRLRVASERTSWAWIGFSYGAWCSAMITMLHPDRYAAAMLLGGYFRPAWPKNAPSWTKEATVTKRYDLISLASQNPPAVALWVQTSTQDPDSWGTTKPFLDAAKAPLSVTAVVDKAGGHTTAAWRPHVPTALTWLGATVPGFKPA